MEEDFFKENYLKWRLTGSNTSEVGDLMSLHFFFRDLKKSELFKFFESDFEEELRDEQIEINIDADLDFDFSESDDMPAFGGYEESQATKVSEVQNHNNDLILGLATGEEWAFTDLYNNDYQKIKSFVTKNSGRTADAQDIFQDGIVILLEKIKTPGFEFTCKVGTYLVAP